MSIKTVGVLGCGLTSRRDEARTVNGQKKQVASAPETPLLYRFSCI